MPRTNAEKQLLASHECGSRRSNFPRIALVLLVLSLGPVASAQELDEAPPRLEVAAAARGLTIGKLNLMLGAEGGVLRGPGSSDFIMFLPLRFGLFEDLEVFATPVFQTVDPKSQDRALGFTYRFTHGAVEIGARAYGDVAQFAAVNHATLVVGVPARLHVGTRFALDAGAFLLLTVDPSTYAGMLVPVAATLNASESLFATVGSGLVVPSFPDASRTVGAPFDAAVGYTIPNDNRPLFDVGVRAEWANLRTSEAYAVLGFARIYLFL